MGQSTPMELTKIKKIVADIQEFPDKIDSPEQAKNARSLLKKYAVLSEKIERNVVISSLHQEDLAKIRTEKFKTIRRTLKDKANSILQTKKDKSGQSEKLAKKSVKTPAAKKASKADEPVAKKTTSKKDVKKSPESSTATDPKEGA